MSTPPGSEFLFFGGEQEDAGEGKNFPLLL